VSAYFTLAVLAGQVNGAELDSLVSSFPAEIGTSEYVIKLKEIVEEFEQLLLIHRTMQIIH
jgi:hypothetical protein